MKIDCPHCGVHGSVDDSLAGRKLRCPKCSKIFLVTDDMVPDTAEDHLVRQEILHDPPFEAPLAVSAVVEPEEDLGIIEETAIAEEIEIPEDDILESVPVQSVEEEELELDNDGEDESDISTCSACGQSFATAFLVEIDSKFYCALCQPDFEEKEDDEENLAFDGGDAEQNSIVEDDDFLAFSGDDDTSSEDMEPALAPDNQEVCAGCGESLHPQFLQLYEGQQYCALCLPEDDEENLQLSDTMEMDEVEEIGLEVYDHDEGEDPLDSETTLMAEDAEQEENQGYEVEDEQEYDVDETDSEGEEFDEEGFPQEACSVCGDTFHKDFLQEIDSRLYCGVCQPEVIETISPDALAASGDEEDFEAVEGELDSGTDFTVGDTLKEAWQKTKGAKGAVWGGIIVMYLIIFGISAAGFYGIQNFSAQGDSTTTMVVNGGLQLVTSWLSMLFTGGLTLIGVRRALEQRVSWKMVFAAFSNKKVLSMTIATLLQILLIGIGLILLILPGIYLMVGYALTLPLILDKGLGPWEALETSRKAIHKKWWTVLGMYLVMVLLYMVSIIPLGLGLIWTVPMFMVLIGVLYARLFGFSEEVEEDEETTEEDDIEDEEDAFENYTEESEESL
jgi:uncharacterized membrane protein/formylmethanofuran dehydrogenase subunit E